MTLTLKVAWRRWNICLALKTFLVHIQFWVRVEKKKMNCSKFSEQRLKVVYVLFFLFMCMENFTYLTCLPHCETICLNCESPIFWVKNKNISKCCMLKVLPSMLRFMLSINYAC